MIKDIREKIKDYIIYIYYIKQQYVNSKDLRVVSNCGNDFRKY